MEIDNNWQSTDKPPLKPGERILQLLGPHGFDAVMVEKGGRSFRLPVLLFALIEREGKQYLRGYLNPLQNAPVEDDPRFVGYFHQLVSGDDWNVFRQRILAAVKARGESA